MAGQLYTLLVVFASSCLAGTQESHQMYARAEDRRLPDVYIALSMIQDSLAKAVSIMKEGPQAISVDKDCSFEKEWCETVGDCCRLQHRTVCCTDNACSYIVQAPNASNLMTC